jgi:hypothetical protein
LFEGIGGTGLPIKHAPIVVFPGYCRPTGAVRPVDSFVFANVPIRELIPVRPLGIEVQLSHGIAGHHAQLLVAGDVGATTRTYGWVSVEVPRVLDRELIVIM